MTIEPTLGLEAAFRQSWQAVVIGAGPAGAVAARGLARRGLQVLLIDRKRFPRWKTCGGCLNERALSVLRELGLEKTLDELGAVPLHEFRLVTSGRQVTLPLPGGRALSRTRFDAALVQAAIDAGAHFLPETRGEVRQAVEGHRLVELRQGGDSAVVSARVVIVADGLGSRSLANSPEFRCQ